MRIPSFLCAGPANAKRGSADIVTSVLDRDESLMQAVGSDDVSSDECICALYEGQIAADVPVVELYAFCDALADRERSWRKKEGLRQRVVSQVLRMPWGVATFLANSAGVMLRNVPDGARQYLLAVDAQWDELAKLRFGPSVFHPARITTFLQQVTPLQGAMLSCGADKTEVGVPSGPPRKPDEIRRAIRRVIGTGGN